jgi:8-oxo-dGTP pyrophosphatase MutT (NUDIX family)
MTAPPAEGVYAPGVSDDETIYPWREDGRETAFRSRVFDVTRRRRVEASPEGRAGEFYVLEAPDWVNVVALTPDRQLVLVEQWRHGVERTTLEIPGGMVDPGEGALEAAKRELAEETGYSAPAWSRLGVIDPNPAIQANRCHTYLAEDATRAGTARFDGHERCRLVLAPFERVGELVASGRITHALVVVALHFASLREAGFSPPPTPAAPRAG